MKLLTIDNRQGGEPGVLLPSGEVLNLRRAATGAERLLPGSLRDILEAGEPALALVRQVISRVEAMGDGELARLRRAVTLTAYAETPLLTPITEPRLLLAVGLAYKSHLAEMSNTPTPPHPTAFLKAPSSLNAPGADIVAPPGHEHHIDFEGELALVFGRKCHNVPAERALEYVAGYTACNDVSARDWVDQVFAAKEAWPARWTWEVNIMGKSLPGFTPVGPVITTADEIGDPHALQLTTRLNGTVMQSARTDDMIFQLAEQVSYFSRWYTFLPGDILTTGTPAGVGVGRKPRVFMKPGDVIEVEISKIGVLRNKIVNAE
jgi:2-keto-4-pentenoate hydratase/2-oxohepta-3-ene-1,7-dioic acid hydratase in catechol pathway